MTPLDSLERQLRERMAYHAEMVAKPGEDPMFHIGILHGLVCALGMVGRARSGQRAGD